MNEFEIVAVINRRIEAVFSALVNFDRIPDWNSSVIEVRWAKDHPIEVGSPIVYVGRFLGRKFESASVITEYLPSSRYSTGSTSGPFLLNVENTLEPVEGGTRLTSVFRGESRGFFKLAEPVLIRLAKNLFESATDNMKALLEAEAL